MSKKGRPRDRKPTVDIPTGDKASCLSIADKINIVMAILTLLSVVGVFFTIHEMRKDRDAAYKPAILMNPIEFEISWNEDGEEEWFTSLPGEGESSVDVDEHGEMIGTIKIPMTIFRENGLETFSVVNIGVGAARDIVFEWDENNVQNLKEYLIERDSSKADFCLEGQSVVFSIGDRIVMTDKPQGNRLMYMLPNAEETYILALPTAYSVLVHEIVKNADLGENLPHLVLYVDYTDVQGKNMQDAFCIWIQRTFYEVNPDGSGFATYQLVPQLLEM